jgi:exportin-T
VHSLLADDWDWTGARASPAALMTAAAEAAAPGEPPRRAAALGSTEDLRERGELQRAYYLFLHALVHCGLAGVLLGAPPGGLDAAMAALMRGAGTHVDAGGPQPATQPRNTPGCIRTA